MNFLKRLVKNPTVRMGVKTANPLAGIALDTVVVLMDANSSAATNKEVAVLVQWLDDQADVLINELSDSKKSSKRRKEVEIRLHQTLELLQKIGKGEPWQ